MKARTLSYGEIVQIHPEIKPFGGALMVVTETKSYGVKGYIPSHDGERIFTRQVFENIEHTGGAANWI